LWLYLGGFGGFPIEYSYLLARADSIILIGIAPKRVGSNLQHTIDRFCVSVFNMNALYNITARAIPPDISLYIIHRIVKFSNQSRTRDVFRSQIADQNCLLNILSAYNGEYSLSFQCITKCLSFAFWYFPNVLKMSGFENVVVNLLRMALLLKPAAICAFRTAMSFGEYMPVLVELRKWPLFVAISGLNLGLNFAGGFITAYMLGEMTQ